MDGCQLEQKLVSAARDVVVPRSAVRSIGRRSNGSHDQLGAWPQDQVLEQELVDGSAAAERDLFFQRRGR